MVMVTVEILEIEVLFCTYVWVTSYILMVEKAIKKEKVCQNAHLLFLCTKPRLSQAGALLLPKDFVSLSITSVSYTHLTLPTN